MNYFKKYVRVFFINMALFCIVALLSSDIRKLLIKEDGIIENLSAFFFLLTFIIGMYLLFFKRSKNRLIIFGISFAGLIGFLDELSFGQRLFEINFPRINGIEIDAIHDLFQVMVKYGLNNPVQFSIIMIVLLVFLFLFMRLKKDFVMSTYRKISKSTIYFGMLITSLLAMALFIDLDVIPGIVVLEELLEMNIGLAAIFLTLSEAKLRPKNLVEIERPLNNSLNIEGDVEIEVA